MPYIQTISPGKATGETLDAYRYNKQVTGSGRAAKIVRMFSLRAASMRRMVRLWELSMWMSDGPRDLRELVASSVSRLNECQY